MSDYSTSDWKFFLQDIETELQRQMGADEGEIERYQQTVPHRRQRGSEALPPTRSGEGAINSLLRFVRSESPTGPSRSLMRHSPQRAGKDDSEMRLLDASGRQRERQGFRGSTDSYGTFVDVSLSINASHEEEMLQVERTKGKR